MFLTEPWKIAKTPEEVGVSSKMLLKYLDAVEASGLEHHSIVVVKNGTLVCKMNFGPFNDTEPHVLFSLSKLFTSAAAGFAVSEGLLSWDSRVCDVLKDDLPEHVSEKTETVTLEHLLTMGSGLDQHSDSRCEGSWVKYVLSHGCVYEPGTHFQYNSHGTYLVSAMVQKAAGCNIRDYLIPRLFVPLGIPAPDWDTCPDGICVGGWGLHLSSDSIARMGMCLVQNGMWNGKQILPAEWVEHAKTARISTADNPNVDNIDWRLGYSYQTWMCRGGRYRGDGAYGQACIVSPATGMTVAVTAGILDMGIEFDMMDEFLFAADGAEPGTPEEQAELKRRLETLSLEWPDNDGSGTFVPGFYRSDDLTVSAAADAEGPVFTFKTPGSPSVSIKASFDTLRRCTVVASSPEAPSSVYLAKCGWKNGILRLTARAADAPFFIKASFTFTENGMTAETFGAAFPSGKFELVKKA